MHASALIGPGLVLLAVAVRAATIIAACTVSYYVACMHQHCSGLDWFCWLLLCELRLYLWKPAAAFGEEALVLLLVLR